MRFNVVLSILFLFLTLNMNAQLESYFSPLKSFTDKKSGFNKSDLKGTILLVEGFETIKSNCKNKPILQEVGLSLMPVYHCPREDMSKRDKKDIAKFNKKLDKKIDKQKKLWKSFEGDYQLVTSKDLGAEEYADKNKYRFVLKYNYVAAFIGFANGNSNKNWTYRYTLYDRLNDKNYDTFKNRSTITHAKKLSNLSKIIKNLNKCF